MAAPDPVDVRLLTCIAETGRAAVHEIAGRLGMDVRDVAARLAALSTSGLPIVVGVECDPNGIRNALAAAGAWSNHPSGAYPVGPQPGQQQPGQQPPQQAPPPPGQPGSGPPSGNYPVYGGPSGPHPSQSGQHPGQGAQQFPPQQFAPQPPPPSFGSGPYPGPNGPPQQPPAPGPPGGAPAPPQPGSTWGPPGSASWARGDQHGSGAAGQPPQSAQQPQSPQQQTAARSGTIGSKLDVTGLEGERISIQLVEVVDPADFLLSAAGHTLREGERAVVVHTELTNNGSMPYNSLPDLYLVLVASDASAVTKASVSLSSRPPHRTGVPPGETAGGHTVFVLPDSTELSAVRWSPRPGDEQRTLTWDITDQ